MNREEEYLEHLRKVQEAEDRNIGCLPGRLRHEFHQRGTRKTKDEDHCLWCGKSFAQVKQERRRKK